MKNGIDDVEPIDECEELELEELLDELRDLGLRCDCLEVS